MDKKNDRLGARAYVVGGLSFIPLIGVIFGIICIIWGFLTKKSGGRNLAMIGASGILFTILLYGSLFYFGFVQKDGVFDNLRQQGAENMLASLVPQIEYFKAENGAYPKDLETLQKSLPEASAMLTVDVTKIEVGNSKATYFYYENLGDTYYLLGTGTDNIPFTEDDIIPKLNPKGNVGFRIKGQ
jgi:hypothetical protein